MASPGESILTSLTETVTKEISYDDLKTLLAKGENLLLIDVRTKEEVDKGRIQGSVHIPLDTVEAAFAMADKDFQDKYGVTKPTSEGPELVFHCQMGKRGGIATEKAYELGYEKARNYTGGYKEWSAKEGK